MRAKDLKRGMMVLISNDLSITSRRCTSGKAMENMRNKVYKVRTVGTTSNIAQIYDNIGNTWTFAVEDLSPAKLPYQELKTNDLATGKPELFNPEQLIL